MVNGKTKLSKSSNPQKQNDMKRQILVVQAQQSMFKESSKRSRKSIKKKKVQEESEDSEEENEDEESSSNQSHIISKTPSPVISKNKSPTKSEPSKSPSSNYIRPSEEYLGAMKSASNTSELRRAANEAIVNFLKDQEKAEQHRREFLAIITDSRERTKMEMEFEVERKQERSLLLQLNKDVNANIQHMYFQLNQ